MIPSRDEYGRTSSVDETFFKDCGDAEAFSEARVDCSLDKEARSADDGLAKHDKVGEVDELFCVERQPRLELTDKVKVEGFVKCQHVRDTLPAIEVDIYVALGRLPSRQFPDYRVFGICRTRKTPELYFIQSRVLLRPLLELLRAFIQLEKIRNPLGTQVLTVVFRNHIGPVCRLRID